MEEIKVNNKIETMYDIMETYFKLRTNWTLKANVSTKIWGTVSNIMYQNIWRIIYNDLNKKK